MLHVCAFMFMSQKLHMTPSITKRICSFDMFAPVLVNINTNQKKKKTTPEAENSELLLLQAEIAE